jgi:GDP-fucose transporter C1
MLQQTTSLRAIAMCGVIVAGFFLGVDSEKSEADLSFTGQLPTPGHSCNLDIST